MSNGILITEAYEPDDDLRELLEIVRKNSAVHHTQNRKISLTSELSARQIHYTVEFKNETITGTDTITPLGVFSSLKRNQEMASALTLANSLQYGKPTLTYEDRADLQNGTEYLDVTGEWYHKPFVEKGVPERRMQNRKSMYETTEVSLESLEERAKRWLSSI